MGWAGSEEPPTGDRRLRPLLGCPVMIARTNGAPLALWQDPSPIFLPPKDPSSSARLETAPSCPLRSRFLHSPPFPRSTISNRASLGSLRGRTFWRRTKARVAVPPCFHCQSLIYQITDPSVKPHGKLGPGTKHLPSSPSLPGLKRGYLGAPLSPPGHPIARQDVEIQKIDLTIVIEVARYRWLAQGKPIELPILHVEQI